MIFIETISSNLLSIPLMFFILGILAGVVKSDLSIPESIGNYLTIYLMLSIGFKGGVTIAEADSVDNNMWILISLSLILGFIQPYIGHILLQITTKIDIPTSAAIAAHYGSISVVTFITASAFLKSNQIEYAGYIVAIMALMEAPAILSGLHIAHRYAPSSFTNTNTTTNSASSHPMHKIFTNGAIVLLLGSFVIGWQGGAGGMEKMEGFIVAPFQGMLSLFLLDMGLTVAKELGYLRKFTIPLFLFGIYMPLIGAAIGLSISMLLNLDLGTGMLFMTLCASASYIAVPAVMRHALPQAKAALYIPISLAITFPFNIIIGIPLYYAVASRFLG